MVTQGQDIQTVEAEHLLQVYRRVPIVLTHGKGSYVYDIEGHAYLDFLSGIGGASLGHAHPGLATALGAPLVGFWLNRRRASGKEDAARHGERTGRTGRTGRTR